MPSTRIKVADFIKASKAYVEKSAKAGDANKSGVLSRAEAAKLPKDLRDNFKAVQEGTGRGVSVKSFATKFARYVATSARRADTNKDGYLNATESKKLPADLRDNFLNFVRATQGRPDPIGGTVALVKSHDTTPASRIAAHEKAYGAGPIGYREAFARAVNTVIQNEEFGESPRAITREFGGPDGEGITSDAKLDAEMKRLMKAGGLELLPVGDSDEMGTDPKKSWIFSVDVEHGSDHGFWVSVDRKTGESFVDGFN